MPEHPTKESGIPERPWYGPEERWKELRDRMETAEAERDALREALTKIVDFQIQDDASPGFHFASVRAIAREVLTRCPE